MKDEAYHSLSKLIGLPLSIARNAADMKVFHFGTVRPHSSGSGTVGQFALHVQSPWRLIGTDGIITGLFDHFEPAEAGGEIDVNDCTSGNLEQKRLLEVLQGYDAATRSIVNGTDQLVVEGATIDEFGGFELRLTGGFRLQVFPCGSRGEEWRFFVPDSVPDSPAAHLVMEGGHRSRGAPGTPGRTSQRPL